MKTIYIDPSYEVYYNDKLFDLTDPILNRDDILLPFSRIRNSKLVHNVNVNTADFLITELDKGRIPDHSSYYSLGILKNIKKINLVKKIKMKAIVIFEPPVVDLRPYKLLPDLTKIFEKVYIHNISGHGYSLNDVDQSKLRKFYWPINKNKVFNNLWEINNRSNKIVVVNGNHKPKNKIGELYSKRIEAMVGLAKYDCIDLYGYGWSKWYSRTSMWPKYLLNYFTLMSIYKGSCQSKYDILSKYKFCLCFENMIMDGYVTEKIFDCFYVGTIPIYLGAGNIDEIIPIDSYIDFRKFDSWVDLYNYVTKLNDREIQRMKLAGKEFIQSNQSINHLKSLQEIFND